MKVVDETSAQHVERDGDRFYFRSDSCRKTFLSTSTAPKHEYWLHGYAIYTCSMPPEVLEDFNRTFHRLRQSGIDEELFDVLSGVEALSQHSESKSIKSR